MIYPEIDLEVWLKAYPSLTVTTTKCDSCKALLTSTMPFREDNWVGVTSPPCQCGESNNACSNMTCVDDDETEEWIDLVQGVVGCLHTTVK